MERETYDRMRALEQTHWWYAARRQILTDQILRLPLPDVARIVEVGCGAGGNLDLLRRFGDVQGVEPDPDSRAYAATRSGLTIQSGLLPGGLPDLGEPFDLVAAFDVIEHVEDDVGAVATLARQLKPGGFLVTTVPANAWLWSEHDARHHHKRRYRLSDYRALFEAADLQVRRASHFNTVLFPLIAAARLVKAVARLPGGDEDAHPPPAVNALLRGLFATESHLLKVTDMPFGVSILLVAQRPD